MQLLVSQMHIVILYLCRFTGQVATPGIGNAFQEADLLSMTTITKQNYQIKNVEDIPKIVHEAFHVANSGRKGPVVIDFPKDMEFYQQTLVYQMKSILPHYQVKSEPEYIDIKTLVSYISKSKSLFSQVQVSIILNQINYQNLSLNIKSLP